MTARTWHKGPPPHAGWWNASIKRYEDLWRWWDGRCWSRSVVENSWGEDAASAAKTPSGTFYVIEWSDYYPEGARVPRIDPTKERNK